jgi:hypothetical protein
MLLFFSLFLHEWRSERRAVFELPHILLHQPSLLGSMIPHVG